MEPNLEKSGSSNLNRSATGVGAESNVHQLYTKGTSVPTRERENWKDMLDQFYTDISNLWLKESELIRTEMNEKFADIKTGAGSLVGGGTVLFIGAMCLAATAIIALDIVLQLWLSALIVTAVFFIVGGIMLSAAKKKLEANKLKPTRSVQALNEIKTSFKEKVYEFKKH